MGIPIPSQSSGKSRSVHLKGGEKKSTPKDKEATHKDKSLESKKELLLQAEPALVGPPLDETEAAKRARTFELEQLRLDEDQSRFDAKQNRMAEVKAKHDAARELSASQRRRKAARGRKSTLRRNFPRTILSSNQVNRTTRNQLLSHKAECSPRSRSPSQDTRRVSIFLPVPQKGPKYLRKRARYRPSPPNKGTS